MHDIVREPEQMLNGNKLGLFGVVLHSLANGCGPVALTSFSIICCTVSVPKLVHWSSYCFVWSLTGQFFLPFLLSEVGWHPNSSAVNHGVVDTMVTSIALFHYYISDRVSVCHTKAQHMISLRTRPLHGEEGSGHAPTFELNQGSNADLNNDSHWWPMMLWKWFSPGFHMFTVTNC